MNFYMEKWSAEIWSKLRDAVNLNLDSMARLVTHLRRGFSHVTLIIKAAVYIVNTSCILNCLISIDINLAYTSPLGECKYI